MFFEERALLPEGVEAGMQFDGLPPGAATPDMPADAIYTVTEVYPEHVVLDGNHPLAGIALRLDLVVRDVREATDEEIEAGSVGASAFTVLEHRAAGHAAALSAARRRQRALSACRSSRSRPRRAPTRRTRRRGGTPPAPPAR